MAEKAAAPPEKAPQPAKPPPLPVQPSPAPITPAPITPAPVSNTLAGREPPAAKGRDDRKAPLPLPTDEIDLKGKALFEPTPSWKEYLDTAKRGADVPVKFGALARGTAHVQKEHGGTYRTSKTAGLPLSHPFFAGLPVTPALAVEIKNDKVSGHATVMKGERLAPGTSEIFEALEKNAELLGMLGFKLKLPSKPDNKIEGGDLIVGTSSPIHLTLAGWLSGGLDLKLVNEQVAFKATVDIKVRGLEGGGQLVLARDGKGVITGEVDVAVAISKLAGKAHVKYVGGDVSFTGTLTYTTEKIKGSVTLVVADFEEAEKAARAQIDPSNLLEAARPAGEESKGKEEKVGKGERGIAAWGELDFAFTDWMTGKAQVVIGPRGYLTVIGEIAPPKEVLLMKERPFNKHLFSPRPKRSS